MAYFSFVCCSCSPNQKIGQNFKPLISENDYCRFVGNVEVDLELTFYTHKPLFDPSRAYFNFQNCQFWPKNAIFSNYDHFADMADSHKKNYGNARKDHLNPFRTYEPYLTCLLCLKSIFDVVEAKNAIFEKSNFAIFQKYSICGSKIEISGYPKKTSLPKLTFLWIWRNSDKNSWNASKLTLCFFLAPHCI